MQRTLPASRCGRVLRPRLRCSTYLHEDGLREVTLRPESVPFEFHDNQGTNPACFWHGEHWALRMPVTDDLLRGSGRSIPVQFAAYLGCRPGVNRVFASGSSKVRAVWATTTLGPSLGSVRPALAAKGAEEGDLLFVCYHPGSPDIELRVVKRTPLGSLASPPADRQRAWSAHPDPFVERCGQRSQRRARGCTGIDRLA